MEEQVSIRGDFSNIINYFGQMLSIKKLREFDVHDFHMKFDGYETIIDADSQKKKYMEDFPDSRNVDRIVYLKFSVRKGDHVFNFRVGWDFANFNGMGNEQSEAFLDMLDRSTFRFF